LQALPALRPPPGNGRGHHPGIVPDRRGSPANPPDRAPTRGGNLNRPGLGRTLRAVEDGAEALVVARLDRLSRSVLDFTGLVKCAQDAGWRIVVLDLGLDMTTPQGELAANIFAAFARFERKLISARTKEALAVKRRQGRLGRPATLPPNVQKRIRQLHSRGWSYAVIARQLTDENVPTAQGGKRWYPSMVRGVVEGWRD
jgi:DNA invertase Pin-like site-specific DNA recombinase